MGIRVDILNHASALIRVGPVALLSDPWFEGTCFSGGWGLRYANPEAFEISAEATHLWISHWHSDHMHTPSLARIAQRNPQVRVLANVSANFSMVDRLRQLGFQNVVALPERTKFSIAEGVAVSRYPTAGIDNMLHVRGDGWSILNYNDCNLPRSGVTALSRVIGPVDLLLTNYNHAGKLFEQCEPEQEKRVWYDKLASVVELFDARHVIPFASAHYYRVAASAGQNASLLSHDDLDASCAGDSRYCTLRVGDHALFSRPGDAVAHIRRLPPLPEQTTQLHDYADSVPLDDLLDTCWTRCRQLRTSFGALARLTSPLRVAVSDLNCCLELDLVGPSGRVCDDSRTPDIEAHSQAISDWLGRRFGDDTFFAGAHFKICQADTTTIQRWALVTLLEASGLDPRHMMEYLRSMGGIRFLWSRREEIVSSITSNRLVAAQPRL